MRDVFLISWPVRFGFNNEKQKFFGRLNILFLGKTPFYFYIGLYAGIPIHVNHFSFSSRPGGLFQSLRAISCPDCVVFPQARDAWNEMSDILPLMPGGGPHMSISMEGASVLRNIAPGCDQMEGISNTRKHEIRWCNLAGSQRSFSFWYVLA